MIETKLAQCLQMQIHDEDNVGKISWSMVSNAADRPRSTSTEIVPSSIAESRSFVPYNRAVSVL